MSEEQQTSHRANIPVAERIAAKMAEVAAESGEGEETLESSGGESAEVTETPIAEVTTEAAPAVEETDEQKSAREIRDKRAALFDEKLKAAREKRQAQRLEEKARAERKAAAADRKAAEAERAALADGRKDFRKFFEANGMDARQAYEEMTKQALEAGTPEAEQRRQLEALQKHFEDKFTPVQRELEALREREAKWAAQSHEHAMVSNYQQAAVDPAYTDLRAEYDDATLMEYVRHYDRNPSELVQHADTYGVRLTDPANGFTMREILDVLKSAQDAHERAKQARRAAIAPTGPQSAQPSVNGTAPRRNAGTAVGNDLAAQRASTKAEAPGLSPKERMRQRAAEEIRRHGGR
jgi:hypothetical protein